MIVGITGKYCSGKKFLARLFVECGYTQINVDAIGHEALDAKQEELFSMFGDEIAYNAPFQQAENTAAPSVHKKIDRKKLRRIVFADEKKLRALERVVHPWMAERVREVAAKEKAAQENKQENVQENVRAGGEAKAGGRLVICAALLHKMGLDALCDTVILVHTSAFIRLLRARRRDKISIVQILQRFYSQRCIPAKKNLKNVTKAADIIIVNGVYSARTYQRCLSDYLTGSPSVNALRFC